LDQSHEFGDRTAMAERVYFAKGQDADLEKAFASARSTFRYFWRELSWEQHRIVKAWNVVAVKVAFTDGDLVEHMWVNDLGYDGRTITGSLLNEPLELTNVEQGDEVEIEFGERVEDWMLASERGVLGGFTINLMRTRMAPDERAGHDEAWGLLFPDRVELPPDGDDHPMALNMADSFGQFLR
jgi:uncharacterized protein YegJ (DUF2314 family)